MKTNIKLELNPAPFWRTRILLAGLLTASLSCTNSQSVDLVKRAPNNEIGIQNQASWYTEVQFDKDAFRLDPGDESALNDLVDKSKKTGSIHRIKVISWADQAYPSSKKKELSRYQIELADKRNEQIKKYFDKRYPTINVEVYNMAKRPNALQELFDTSDASTKKTIEDTGALFANESESNASKRASMSLVLSVLKP